MTSVSIRDLRYDFRKVESLLQRGEEIQVTKRNKVIARLVPEKASYPPLPDFLADLREIYGDKVFDITAAELLSNDRNRL